LARVSIHTNQKKHPRAVGAGVILFNAVTICQYTRVGLLVAHIIKRAPLYMCMWRGCVFFQPLYIAVLSALLRATFAGAFA
jgi:hypothetical protein